MYVAGVFCERRRAVVLAAAGSGLVLLAVLACPISMGLMMLFMGRGMMRGKNGAPDSHDERSEPALADLKAEQVRLGGKTAVRRPHAAGEARRAGVPRRRAVCTGRTPT